MTILDYRMHFPPAAAANEEGVLAIGGVLTTESLLKAYRQGIFPWYDGEIPVWWHPDPRFVLFPEELIVHKSMRPLLNKSAFHITINQCFRQVMESCAAIERKNQLGTWIQPEMIRAYTELHQLGYAVSVEAWQHDQLVGGLYGIKMGKVFFGESMFSHVSNASKFAFIQWVKQLKEEGVQLIDCQSHTHHLESLGARFIDRTTFLQLLQDHIE